MALEDDEKDWEVTPEGLYIATRGFLIRRGYCCANRCRNCPYINWRHQRPWEPIPAERVQRARVTPKAAAGAQELLTCHEHQLEHAPSPEAQHYHQRMSTHYRLLLERWGTNPGPV